MLLILPGHFNYGTGKPWLKVIYDARLCQQQMCLSVSWEFTSLKIMKFLNPIYRKSDASL